MSVVVAGGKEFLRVRTKSLAMNCASPFVTFRSTSFDKCLQMRNKLSRQEQQQQIF